MSDSDERPIEDFLDWVEATFGDQIFDVALDNLEVTLLSIAAAAYNWGLSTAMPAAIADYRKCAIDEGDYEVLVYPPDDYSPLFVVGVFPVFEDI